MNGFTNPYTMEPFHETIKSDVTMKIETLQNKGFTIDFVDLIERDKKSQIKQKTVDIFCQIEVAGYSCNINWFLLLTTGKLKKLYRELEDIWNYRAQLSFAIKQIIAPPDGKLFSIPMSQIINYTNKEELQDVILNDLTKISNSNDINNKNLGYMYFLIGLSTVSNECYLNHIHWISAV